MKLPAMKIRNHYVVLETSHPDNNTMRKKQNNAKSQLLNGGRAVEVEVTSLFL
jgi:hypothetical protein